MQPGNINTPWPEVVRLGDGSLWLPGRFCKPKGGGDKARLYYMAAPLELPQMMAPAGDVAERLKACGK